MNQEKDHSSGAANLRLLAGIAVLLILPLVILASGPGWSSSASNYAAANQGQVKNIATSAVARFDANLTGGAGDALHSMINSWAVPTAQTNNYAAVSLGQLKAVAKPFYDRLFPVGYAPQYPWTGKEASANDNAMANLGQVKNLLSFDPTNCLPEWWEYYYFGATGQNLNAQAPRGDGLTTQQAFLMGLNPLDTQNGAAIPQIKPTVTLTSSPSGILAAPANVMLNASAAEVSGTISRVDFYQNGGYLGSDTAAPYAFQLSNLAAGNYQWSAIAVDAAGVSSTASMITLVVMPAAATTDSNRYTRGWGTDQTLLSSVIALDSQKGRLMEGANADLNFPNGFPWFLRTLSEPNSPWWHINSVVSGTAYYSQYNAPVVVSGSTIGGAPPLVAFGSQGSGSPLYVNQSYNFGVVAGGQAASGTNDLLVEVYQKSDFNNNAANIAPVLSSTFTLPRVGTPAWTAFSQNGYVADFQISQSYNGKAINFDTRVQYVAGANASDIWGQNMPWPLLVSHKSGSSDFVYKVSYMGVTVSGSFWRSMAIDSAQKQTYNLTYSLDFDQPSPWKSTYIDQPHFQGVPLPSAYQGKTVDELVHNAPAVSGTLGAPTGNSLTTVDNSTELRSHPVLDKLVTDMGSDPMALANYVLNEIDLTDAIGYNANGQVADQSINSTGVSRDALATYLEGQGSPTEQCALLVYLLRKAGTPCGYVFPQQNGTLMFDEQLSKLLRMQLRGAKDYFGNSSVPQLIPVNYPWVAAYINNQWVHIFPWLKDTAVEEGDDLWKYMPTGYQTASQWLRHYLLDDPNIRSLSTEGDNPGTLFPLWVRNQLQTNYPGTSIDDLGITFYNRRNYYTRWEDFPRPWRTPTISNTNLTTNLDLVANIFDTVNVQLFKDLGTGKVQTGQQPIITTGTLRLADLHDRRFLLYHQAINSGAQYNVFLSLEAFRSSATGTNNFQNDTGTYLNKQVASAVLTGTDDALLFQINYQRHRQLPSNFTTPDYWTPFLGFYENLSISDTRPLRKGDMAALCMDYGRVSQKMQEFQAEKYWNYQQQVAQGSSTVADPEQSSGELLYLMGLSYYHKVSQFQQAVEGWTKTHGVSWGAHGLTKLNPQRNADGTPTLITGTNGVVDINLRYPSVDMSFLRVAWAGNGTSHPDSGDEDAAALGAGELMIGEVSADEHRIINEFFQQSAAISTVKLLDLAQGSTPGSGVVELNSSNYLASGTTNYTVAKTGTTGSTTKTLAAWAGADMWTQITNALSDPTSGTLTTVFITPGPKAATGQQGNFFTGMGAFIIGVGQYGALISSNMVINGGAGDWCNISLPSYSSPPSYVSNTILVNTNNGYSLFSGNLSSSSVSSYAPPVYSNSDFGTITNGISNSSFSISTDYFNTLTSYAANSGYTLPTSYTGGQTAALSQSLNNAGYAGPSSDNRNLISNAGIAATGISAIANGVLDPVNVITGEFYIDAVDLTLNGPMPLEIRRNYGSLNKADNNFGQGWRMSCFPYLAFSSTDSAVTPTLISAAEMDGSVIVYRRQTSPNTLWIPTPGDNPNLANVAKGSPGGLANVYNNSLVLSGSSTYVLTGADGSVRTYQIQSFPVGTTGLTRTRPYLQSWKDNRGNYYTFTFGSDSKMTDYGEVSRIQASNGNYVGFYYDTYGHITEAYTGDGRRLYYQYDSYGDLIQVTLPDASAIAYNYQHLPVTGTGLTANYFNGTSLAGLLLARTDATVNFDWGTGSPDASVPADNFSVRWTGQVQAQFSETYTFYTNSDDGIRLWVNGQQLVNNWTDHGPTENSGTIALVAGKKYDIKLEYYEHTGGATAKLLWSSPSQAKQVIPQSQLFPAATGALTSIYSSHLLTQETKPGGRVLQNDYDSTGRVTVQRSTVGSNLTPVVSGSFNYGTPVTNADKTVSGTTTVTDALNHTTTYAYASSQITSVVDPSGYPVTQVWYSQDDGTGGYRRSLRSRTDKRGLVTNYQYDARGNPVQLSITGNLTGGTSTSETATTCMSYSQLNLVTSSTDALGNVSNYTYADAAHPYLPTAIEKRAPGGSVSTAGLQYEDVVSGSIAAYGLLKQETRAAASADEAVTVYTHNANGFITSITRPTGTSDPAVVANYTYNLRGELISETDALNRATKYAYDARGNRMWQERRDETGALVSWQYNYYNQNGEIEWTQGPRYSPDDYVLKRYDGAGRLSEETKWRSEANASNNGVQAPSADDAAYATAFYFHDTVGNLTEIRDLRHNSTEMGYDAIGQLTSRKFHDGGLTGTVKAQESFGYEPGGQVSSYVSALSATTTKLYTYTGKLKEQHNANGTVLYWQYDLSGRVVKGTLSNGNYWSTAYDDYNRTVTRTLKNPGGTALKSESATFDRRGNVVSKTDVEGNTFTSTYDRLDRTKTSTGPAANGSTAQETSTHVYGAGGKVHLVVDALGQKAQTTSDAEGRPVLTQVRDQASNLIRQTSYVYSPDHQSVTITEGIGASAISTTTFTDTYGKPVLVKHGDGTFQRLDYDNAGNLISSQDEEGYVTVNAYDALNRLSTQTLPGGATTTFVYDAAGNVLQRQMPGSQVLWQTFDTASRKTSECLVGSNGVTSGTTRNFSYTYYSTGAWIGLPQTTTDPRGITFTATTYDDLLRPTTVTASGTGSQPLQSTTSTYDGLGRLKSVEQHDTSSSFTSGTSTLVQRTYDGYGHITSEKVFIDGTSTAMNQFNQTWDASGNRASLASGTSYSTSYTYWADGLLKQVNSGTNACNFAYGTNGLLTSRTNPWRTQTVTSRDALGRILTQQSTLSSGTTPLSESQTWTGRSTRGNYTATRGGSGVWNETRQYGYNGRGQMYYESDAPAAGTYADTLYGFDFDLNVPSTGNGLGVRTFAMRRNNANDYGDWQPGSYVTDDPTFFGWVSQKGSDAFQRPVSEEQSLLVQNSFYTSAATYDSAGNTTWRSYWTPDASQNPQQTLIWDAQGRLVKVSQRDWFSNGYDWRAIYDGLGRRLRTVKQNIAGGANSGTAQTIDSYYDPQVEFLELGVAVNGVRTWKVQGPDLNGRYGSLQGIGGLEATLDETSGTVTPVVNDAFGNVVGWINGGAMIWNTARVGSYGVLPGSTAPVFGEPGVTLAQSLLWRGNRMDPTGLYYKGARYYEPLSGRFLSPDPLGHAASMSLYDYCNGDPVNGLDPDGRCSNSSASNGSFSNYGTSSFSEQMNLQAGYGMDRRMQGNFDMPTLSEAIETGASMAFQATVGTAMNMAQSVATHFYQGMTGTDIKTGNSISGWSQLGNAAMFALDVAPMVGEVKLGGGAMEGVSNVGRGAEVGWASLPGGVRIMQQGDNFVKTVDPGASALARWWGKGSLDAQASGLSKLGDMAPKFSYENGVLTTANAGTYTPGNFWSTWWQGTKRLGTPMNDIRPRNIGANGTIFDPALHPVQQGVYWMGAGTVGASAGYGIYSLFNNQ